MRRIGGFVGLVVLFLVGVMAPASQAAAVDLVNTGAGVNDSWRLDPDKYFAFAFDATSAATVTSATVILNSGAVEADLAGSQVSLCSDYPSAPGTCVGSFTFDSLAPEGSYLRATFTGSFDITAGTYWFKVHGIPSGKFVTVMHGLTVNSGVWDALDTTDVINWTASGVGFEPQYNRLNGLFTLSGTTTGGGDTPGGDTGAVEEPIPPVLQQYQRDVTGSCPDGWSASWALWPHDNTGGFVCSRTVNWDAQVQDWVPA